MKSITHNWPRLRIIFILVLLSGSVIQSNQNAQTAFVIEADESCESLIAERVDIVRGIDNRTPKRLSAPNNQKLISPALKALTKDIPMDLLVAYRLDGPRQTALIMITMKVGGPLSEDSIQDWFVQNGKNAFTFRSIATNPNLLFWDAEGGLNYFTILYTKGAEKDASSDLVSLDLRRFRFSASGITELIDEEESVRCVPHFQKPM